MKKILGNLFVFFIASLVAFLFAEFVVRMVYKDKTYLFPRYHNDVQYGEFTLRRLRPNSTFWHTSVDGTWKFVVNSKGLRNDREFDYKKPSGKIRVLALGDSHTQGYEVRQEATYSQVIEKYLHSRGIDAEVINAGISGYSNAEALLFLENEGFRYEPDYVVLGFFANDYQDNIKASFFGLDEQGELVVQKKEHIPGVKIQNIIYSLPFVKFLSENSYFYSVIFNATWEFFKGQLLREAAEAVTDYAVSTEQGHGKYEEELTAALIDRIYKFSTGIGAKLIVLDIPEVGSDSTSFESSVSPLLRGQLPQSADYFVDSEGALADYSGAAEFHLPRGHRHISEFTHTLLGLRAAQYIERIERDDH